MFSVGVIGDSQAVLLFCVLLYVCEKGRSVRSEVKLRFFGILALLKSEQRPFICVSGIRRNNQGLSEFSEKPGAVIIPKSRLSACSRKGAIEHETKSK
jgi:hypothetical protein